MAAALVFALSRLVLGYRLGPMWVDLILEVPTGEDGIEIPWKDDDRGVAYIDLSEQPQRVAQIEAARRHPPLQSFLATLNSGDSLFRTVRVKTWMGRCGDADAAASEFGSRVDIVFSQTHQNLEFGTYRNAARKLADLVAHEGGESQRVVLRARRCRFHDTRQDGYALSFFLCATGESPDQAELRWGLGLARMQQAFLYLSRVLRQQIAQSN